MAVKGTILNSQRRKLWSKIRVQSHSKSHWISVADRDDIVLYTAKCHNFVNQKLGKKQFAEDVGQIYKRWLIGWRDQ